jgi:hypothetical protein
MRTSKRLLGLIVAAWMASTCGARSELGDGGGANYLTAFAVRAVLSVPQDTCVPPPVGPDEPEQDSGILDAKYATEYHAALSVVRVGPKQLPLGPIHFKSLEVEVLDASGKVLTRKDGTPARFNQTVTGEIELPMPDRVSLARVDAMLLDAATTAEIADRLQAPNADPAQVVFASLVLKADADDGHELVAQPFVFPIQVCYGCLCEKDTCSGATEPPAPVCRIGQDALFDCRLRPTKCD